MTSSMVVGTVTEKSPKHVCGHCV